MAASAQDLVRIGAEAVVLPCNTAEPFLPQVEAAAGVPVLGIVRATVAAARDAVPGLRRVGVLATDGTLAARTYHDELARDGLEAVVPTAEDQALVMAVIYEQVKAGRPADVAGLAAVADRLVAAGAQCVLLACTELSVLHDEPAAAHAARGRGLGGLARPGHGAARGRPPRLSRSPPDAPRADPLGSALGVVVGLAGFEPTTSSSRTRRATKLRHSPSTASVAERGSSPPPPPGARAAQSSSVDPRRRRRRRRRPAAAAAAAAAAAVPGGGDRRPGPGARLGRVGVRLGRRGRAAPGPATGERDRAALALQGARGRALRDDVAGRRRRRRTAAPGPTAARRPSAWSVGLGLRRGARPRRWGSRTAARGACPRRARGTRVARRS